MPRSIPDLTVVLVDTAAHDLSRLALKRTLEQITPAAVHVYSDRRLLEPISAQQRCPVRHFETDPIASFADLNSILWHKMPTNVETSHLLIIQYDGWVLDGSQWQDAWLTYDYIGAPWPWHPAGSNVGNGGFSLRSARLMRYLADNPSLISPSHPEDDVLCRTYRPILERFEFKWATATIADQFSFERTRPHPTFGFHGIFNVPLVLGGPQMDEWRSLAPAYVRQKSEWNELELALSNRGWRP